MKVAITRASDGLGLVVAAMWGALAAALVSLLAYWNYEAPPFDPPTNVRVVGPTQLRVSDTLQIQRTLCVRAAGVPAIRSVRWFLRGDGNYQAPDVRVLSEGVGCSTRHVIYPIPDELPPGHYRVNTQWTVRLNPLREVTIPGGDVEVDIVP